MTTFLLGQIFVFAMFFITRFMVAGTSLEEQSGLIIGIVFILNELFVLAVAIKLRIAKNQTKGVDIAL